MTFIGKLLKGAKGIGLQILKTALPNIESNKAMAAGGEGKLHLPSAAASWIYAIIALLSLLWTLYRLYQGESIELIQQEQELING